MSTFVTTIIPSARWSTGQRGAFTAPSAISLEQRASQHSEDHQQDCVLGLAAWEEKEKEEEHSSFHSKASCDPYNKTFCPIYSKNTASLSLHGYITVSWKTEHSHCQFCTTWKELHFLKNRVRGRRSTGLVWISCLKEEPGKNTGR